jgi:TonB family protein
MTMNKFVISICLLLSSYNCVARQWTIETRVEPRYPFSAVRTGAEGCVSLQFFINSKGVPTNIEVIKSVPEHIFNQSATLALSQWKFVPTSNNANRSPERQVMRFDFSVGTETQILHKDCDGAVLSNESNELSQFVTSRLTAQTNATDLEALNNSIKKIIVVLPSNKQADLEHVVTTIKSHYDIFNEDELANLLIRFDTLNYFQILELSTSRPQHKADSTKLSAIDMTLVPLLTFRQTYRKWELLDMLIGMERSLYDQISDQLLAIEIFVDINGKATLLSTCRTVNPDIFHAINESVNEWELQAKVSTPQMGRFIFGIPAPNSEGSHYNCEQTLYPDHIDDLRLP